MSAIAGLIAAAPDIPAEQLCGAMLDAQAAYGPHDRALACADGVALGRRLYRLVPEDRFDRQPLTGGGGRLRLAADIRIDNREALLRRLELTGSAVNQLSDAALLLRAWEAWGEETPERIRGDFAFALWDEETGQLRLARDPIGQRPLHYGIAPGRIAFASMPEAVPIGLGHPTRPDKRRLAEWVADFPHFGRASFYEGVSRVEPGSVVTIGRSGEVKARRYWRPSTKARSEERPEQLVEELRAHLDRAVEVRMRRAAGALGSHLSSGLDSSAVAATAARSGSGESILAFTSAPRAGFDGPVPLGRMADETPLARLVAQKHPNLRHIILRPAGINPLGLLGAIHRLSQQPTGHICNNSWWTAINADAREQGASVMLTGELGNLAFSAGGFGVLEDLIRVGRLGAWSREARAAGLPWRGLASFSFAGLIPARVHDLLRRMIAGAAPASAKPPFLARDWAEAVAASPSAHPLETRSSAELGLELIRRTDPGCFRKAVLAGWGIDERDPTADRDLIEFCLALPLDALLKNGIERPLLKSALSDRLPPELLDQTTRGYQMADWYEQIRQEDVRAFAARLRERPGAALLDWEEVDAAIGSWPTNGWERRPVIYRYRMRLLRALSAAEFAQSRSAA